MVFMTIKESVTRNPIIETLSQPNYGRYVAGNSISLIGLWMHRIAVGWLTWKLTESGFWLGAVAFADLAPSIVIGPIGGALADRISRLLIVKVAQTVAMFQAILLAVLFWTDAINIWLLLGLTFINGVVIGFNQPSRLALVSSLVDKDHLPVAVAINSTVFNTARFIGPAAAGVVIVASDVGWAFLINAASYLAMLAALASIRILPEADAKKREKRGVIADIAEGFGYVRRHPGVGPMLLLMLATAVCVRPFVELMPGFAADVYQRGAEGLATLMQQSSRSPPPSSSPSASLPSPQPISTQLALLLWRLPDSVWLPPALVCRHPFICPYQVRFVAGFSACLVSSSGVDRPSALWSLVPFLNSSGCRPRHLAQPFWRCSSGSSSGFAGDVLSQR